MRVGRGMEVEGFGEGISVEEAVREREEKQEMVEGGGWKATSDYGEFRWVEE
jgi:hypothetical protein